MFSPWFALEENPANGPLINPSTSWLLGSERTLKWCVQLNDATSQTISERRRIPSKVSMN